MTSGRQTTHTRTSTEDGPDFCEECSSDRQEWVRWPCAAGREATHTRTSTEDGPDFCEECSSDRQEWVRWPCAAGREATCPTGEDCRSPKACHGAMTCFRVEEREAEEPSPPARGTS